MVWCWDDFWAFLFVGLVVFGIGFLVYTIVNLPSEADKRLDFCKSSGDSTYWSEWSWAWENTFSNGADRDFFCIQKVFYSDVCPCRDEALNFEAYYFHKDSEFSDWLNKSVCVNNCFGGDD